MVTEISSRYAVIIHSVACEKRSIEKRSCFCVNVTQFRKSLRFLTLHGLHWSAGTEYTQQFEHIAPIFTTYRAYDIVWCFAVFRWALGYFTDNGAIKQLTTDRNSTKIFILRNMHTTVFWFVCVRICYGFMGRLLLTCISVNPSIDE